MIPATLSISTIPNVNFNYLLLIKESYCPPIFGWGLVSSSVLDGVINRALCPLCPQCVGVSFSLGLCSFGFVQHTYVPPSPWVRPYGLVSCVETHTHKQTDHTHIRPCPTNVRQTYPETQRFEDFTNLSMFSLFLMLYTVCSILEH